MPKCYVDAIADGDVVFSYPIVLNNMNTPVTEADFIAQAKEDHTEDGFSVSLIDEWRVRDIEPDPDA